MSGVVLEPLVWWPAVVVPAALVVVALLLAAARRRHGRRWVWLLRAVVAALVALAALGPHAGTEQLTYQSRPEVQVVVALDLTASMAVRDAGDGSRLAQAADDVEDLTEALDGQVALVTWGERADVVVPFTTDAGHLARTASLVETERPVEGVGSRSDRPLAKLTRLVARTGAEHPDRATYLLLLTDGENTAGGRQRSYADLGDRLAGGAVVGYGTPEGGPIPLDPDRPDRFVPDPDGEGPALSRRDDENLQRIADELGVERLSRATIASMEDVAALLVPEPRTVPGTTAPLDVTWVVALLLLGLLLPELRGASRARREAVDMRRSA